MYSQFYCEHVEGFQKLKKLIKRLHEERQFYEELLSHHVNEDRHPAAEPHLHEALADITADLRNAKSACLEILSEK